MGNQEDRRRTDSGETKNEVTWKRKNGLRGVKGGIARCTKGGEAKSTGVVPRCCWVQDSGEKDQEVRTEVKRKTEERGV